MSPPFAASRPPAVASKGAIRTATPPPARRALVVAADAGREQALAALDGLGYAAEAAADPYAAVARLCRERGQFGRLVLSLAAVYDEELPLIETVKRRLGPVEVVVCDVDGRGAEFAEAMRLGADALLVGGVLHRLAAPPSPAAAPEPVHPANDDAALTPDELHALLGDD